MGKYPGGSKVGISKQIRMASECGPMHPPGCGFNQGQGQGQGQDGQSKINKAIIKYLTTPYACRSTTL